MTKSETNRAAAKYMYLSLQNVTVDVYSDKKKPGEKENGENQKKKKKKGER